MQELQKIKARLERLKRQEAYIKGMLLAEESAYEKAEDALKANFTTLSGLDYGNVAKGFNAQKNAIGKRKAKEELARRNLFNL